MANLSYNNRYFPALDGLRGLAILLVVFLHNFRFMNYFFFGWLGVDLFFVISGFLITGILVDSLDQPHYLRNFYMRRLLRIFPLYYLTLIICFFILPLFRDLHFDPVYYKNNQAYMWTYLQNWLFIFKPPATDQSLLHTWSLAVEEQFYLFWPLLILIIRNKGRLLFFALLLLVIVGIARYVVYRLDIAELGYASLFTFTRIDGLCIGAAVSLIMRMNPALLRNNTPYIVLLFAAGNFAFYFINRDQGFGLPYLAFIGYTTFAMLFGLLVFEAADGRSRLIHYLFANPFMKFFGKISYALYVFHWPVYLLTFDRLRQALSSSLSPSLASISSATLATGIAILLSVFSYHYFEKPFLKLKAKFT